MSTDARRSAVLGDSTRFGIPAHIHVCVTGAGSVILDVKRDKYLGLGREETEFLADVVAGWPMPVWRRSVGGDERGHLGEVNAMCESLVADDVLQRLSAAETARIVPALHDMRGEWISMGDELEVPGRLALRHVLHFLTAFLWARCSLACRPFYRIVDEVRSGKARRGGSGIHAWDARRLATLVDVFRQLRPFLFAAEGHCLLHALTLIRFLSHYQLHPEWVVGVTTQPWGAHSWVQWGNYLLDSNPEKVCGYTPIMSV